MNFLLPFFHGKHRQIRFYDWIVRIVLGELRWMKRFEQFFLWLSSNHRYRKWIARFEPNQSDLRYELQRLHQFSFHPYFLIVLVVSSFETHKISPVMKGIRNQIYKNWELFMVFIGEDDPLQNERIQLISEGDERIRLTL